MFKFLCIAWDVFREAPRTFERNRFWMIQCFCEICSSFAVPPLVTNEFFRLSILNIVQSLNSIVCWYSLSFAIQLLMSNEFFWLSIILDIIQSLNVVCWKDLCSFAMIQCSLCQHVCYLQFHGRVCL